MGSVRIFRRFTVFLGAAALCVCGLAAAVADDSPVPPAVAQSARTFITRASLEAPIRFLSSDLLEGRGPGTRADQLTRLYLQTRLEGMGYQPAFANGSWQPSFGDVKAQEDNDPGPFIPIGVGGV